MDKYILVTGGLGYLGSHASVELFERGYKPIIIDNLSNSNINTVNQINKIINSNIIFYNVDITDFNSLKIIFEKYIFYAVIHFAGLKSVEESFIKKDEYFKNNVLGSRNLIELIKIYKVKKLIFSSSAAIYGIKNTSPIHEDCDLEATNPYGENKIEIEKNLNEFSKKNKDFSIVALRYFNPVGAHSSHLIGENPRNTPTNLMPLLCNVANNEINYLQIFGNDYLTPDGTAIRDYIHVIDLIDGHISCLDFLENNFGFFEINLGTGKGLSVLEMIKIFEKTNKLTIKYRFSKKRIGDIPIIFADPTRALKLLNWKSKLTTEDMVRDSWIWKKRSI